MSLKQAAEELLKVADEIETIDIRLIEPAEHGELHLYDTQAELALRLLPFVRIKSSPNKEKNACYFYNRVDKEGAHFISHHLSEESEVVEQELNINEALSLLINGETDESLWNRKFYHGRSQPDSG